MALIFLVGPPAVGKMTVGQSLERVTGAKLFHNHMAIEFVALFFSYGTPTGRHLVNAVRQACFDAFAGDREGSYIFTFVWAFGEPGEKEFLDEIAQKFRAHGHEIYWAELEATQEERLRRNRTENRLYHKPTKRDLEWSERHLLDHDARFRFNSNPGEIAEDNYVRIDNTALGPDEAAAQIAAHFALNRA